MMTTSRLASPDCSPIGGIRHSAVTKKLDFQGQAESKKDFFCKVAQKEVDRPLIGENDTFMALADGYGVTPGHALIVPKEHIESFFSLTSKQLQDAFSLLKDCKEKILGNITDRQAKGEPINAPTGFNIGINEGAQAGRTVHHLHMHLIPRYPGDMDDPKGGVRGVIPEKQKYSGPPNNALQAIYDNTTTDIRETYKAYPYLFAQTSKNNN